MRRRSLSEAFPDFGKRAADKQTHPSGRSGGVPAHAGSKFNQHYPILPLPVPQGGQSGMPSSEMSVMASRFMQNQTMNQDDIEYWASIADNPPYDVDRVYSSRSMPITTSGNNDQGAMFPKEIDDSWREEEEVDELGEAIVTGVEQLIREYIRLALREGEYGKHDPSETGGAPTVDDRPVMSVTMHRPSIRSSPNNGSMGISDAHVKDDDDLIDEDEDEERGPEADEVNAIATGNIRGFTAPVGTGGRSSKKPHWQATADSFGRAKKVNA